MNLRTESRLIRTQNMNWFDSVQSCGNFQIPDIKNDNFIPEHLLDFSQSIISNDFLAGVHFFLDDYRFERLWTNPNRYFPILKRFSCVLSPDFSLYHNMSLAHQLWNVYRSRLLGQMMQKIGIRVIPTISWSGNNSYLFCLTVWRSMESLLFQMLE